MARASSVGLGFQASQLGFLLGHGSLHASDVLAEGGELGAGQGAGAIKPHRLHAHGSDQFINLPVQLLELTARLVHGATAVGFSHLAT
jgi:hypothetical protein